MQVNRTRLISQQAMYRWYFRCSLWCSGNFECCCAFEIGVYYRSVWSCVVLLWFTYWFCVWVLLWGNAFNIEILVEIFGCFIYIFSFNEYIYFLNLLFLKMTLVFITNYYFLNISVIYLFFVKTLDLSSFGISFALSKM